MTEKPIPSKNEEERRKEAGKLKAETERSLEAARAKLAHGVIEAIEKIRKGASIRSLHERMHIHSKTVGTLFSGFQTFIEKGYPFSPIEIEHIRGQMRTYESLRIDFKDIMGLSDEKLERMFPKISPYFETPIQAMSVLNNMLDQEVQMAAYSLRMIS